MSNYFEVSSEEISKVGDEIVLVAFENISLSKFKTINIESDSYLDISDKNVNDSLTLLDEDTSLVCLQPFVINCEGAPSKSDVFLYDPNGTYRITINGVATIKRGSELKLFFNQNKISMIDVVELN